MTDRKPHLIVITDPRTAADVKAAKDAHMAALDAARDAALAYVETAVAAGTPYQSAVSDVVACTATRAGMLAAALQSREGWEKWGELCAAFFRLWEIDIHKPDPRADPSWWDGRTDNHGLDDTGGAS